MLLLRDCGARTRREVQHRLGGQRLLPDLEHPGHYLHGVCHCGLVYIGQWHQGAD